MPRTSRFLLWTAILATLYIGLLLGVSFLATPVKFLAPSLTLPVALDVGRQTFMVFNIMELVCALTLLVLAFLARDRRSRVLVGGVLLLVFIQTVWLLPVLDARVEIILQGDAPPPSQLHTLYIAMDVLKLGLLVAVAARGIRHYNQSLERSGS
ncbi:MAG: DUF4149 domain-containing protein [Pseudomonadota bacterium]